MLEVGHATKASHPLYIVVFLHPSLCQRAVLSMLMNNVTLSNKAQDKNIYLCFLYAYANT